MRINLLSTRVGCQGADGKNGMNPVGFESRIRNYGLHPMGDLKRTLLDSGGRVTKFVFGRTACETFRENGKFRSGSDAGFLGSIFRAG